MQMRRVFLLRALRGGESGSALIEFAIGLGVLLTGVFTLMEICLMFYTYSTIDECAREGARYAIVRGSSCLTNGVTAAGVSCAATADSINTYVKNLGYPNAAGGAMTVNTTYSSDGVNFTTTGSNDPNDIVRVQVGYTFPIKMPFVPNNAISLSAQSQLYIVQ